MINRSITEPGNKELIKNLLIGSIAAEAITRRQHSVKELAPLVDFRQELIALALTGSKSKPIRKLFNTSNFYVDKWHWKVLVVAWPFLSLASILLGIYLNGLFYFLPLVSWFVIQGELKRFQSLFLEISSGSGKWKSYGKILEHVSKIQFQGKELNDLASVTTNASKALHELSALSARWDQRGNFFSLAFMNTLVLFDIKCAYEFEKWKTEHNNELETWIDTIGKIESLNSLATFAFNHPDYSYPSLLDEQPEISIQKMGHPLIGEKSVVTNDIHLGAEAKVYIVTGSNMSGKSTFLRAVGINMILAQAGVPVFAEAMRFTPMLILTSFRQSDSVQENTSYFMAELKRLKEIIEALDQSMGSLVLLDEILRGTNSEDKSHGSEVLLEKLITKNAVTILATHDLKLSLLQSRYPEQVQNYCFESEIVNNELFFDYKIKKGVAQNKNATFLMKKMGIV
jgi:DNA mismatch repair ATPase MutS